MSKTYDYVIVGAGSAGCVMANRLSHDPSVSVLLIESGPEHTSPLISRPRGIGKLLTAGNPHVWDYQASRGEHMPDELLLKGRAIGGSSSVNGMVYVRGAPADYDAWEAQGCEGWGWQDIGRRFVALEDHVLGNDEWRGKGGPLKVSVHPANDPLCDAVIAAAGQIGTPAVADTNHVQAVRDGGFGYQPQTTWGGQRFSAAKAFLDPVRARNNLTVLTGSTAERILFEGGRATAVVVRNASGLHAFAIRREAVLCADAIESPKLLQLSGVGPASLLKPLGSRSSPIRQTPGAIFGSISISPCNFGSPEAAAAGGESVHTRGQRSACTCDFFGRGRCSTDCKKQVGHCVIRHADQRLSCLRAIARMSCCAPDRPIPRASS
ncbi:GMC oxidoreductase [Pseudomonas abietaniphila]|uniref:GMC oxidoreductase n=1 Tax=Pseudomonas abietaniphila TaxID=89065 RepID=A0A1G7V947_9PSED|nr:GMC oxidoreductase [Pseudomonas abietaniphila]